MSGQPLLDWSALALSLFDAFLLCWLGFTVLLEADRRALGVWLSADGLFLGAAFFIAHTAILRNGWDLNSPLVNFWWQAGWWPLILSPFAWYCVILWYSGYWDTSDSSLHRRQAPFFGLVLVSTAGLLGWMLLANPLPDLGSRMGNLGGFHGLAFLFPVYILLCILLALDAILRPGPNARLLGNEARRYARPWLIASTLVLLAVCLLVAFALVWGVNTFEMEYETQIVSTDVFVPLTWLDVIIEILITTAILLIGQAAMVYEVFSSIPLPRSGLRKRWNFAIITGGVVSAMLAGVLIFLARPEVAYLILIPLLTASLAIQNHLAAHEQEMEVEQLRTLARPHQMYERIFAGLDNSAGSEESLDEFTLICTNVMRTKRAALLPLGVLASFLPEHIIHPRDGESLLELPPAPEYLEGNSQPLPVDSTGYRWAVPLISSRGLDGWLFIGERSDGGFYTQEEIEIARAAVQRWMDSLAAAEIARRLVNLQQQKQTETRLLDQKSRRILHDDILPLLHTALLTDPHSPAAAQITEAHQQISRLLREAPPPPPAEIASSGLFAALERIARSEADLLQACLVMDIGDRSVQAAASLPSDTAETVFYAARECLRNIQKHAQQTGDGGLQIRIRSEVSGMLQIIIENNGISRGTDDDALSSSGQGIQLHNAMLAVFGGGLRLVKLDNGDARVTISVPIKQ